MSERSSTEEKRRIIPWYPAIIKTFPDYAELIVRAVVKDLSRYQRFGQWHMLWFRITGASWRFY